MNDISKTNTQTRLNKAIESEGLKINEVYVSMIRNEKFWPNCSAAAWDSVLTWINSGQSLKEYSEKHGKVLSPEKPRIELPPKVIAVKKAEVIPDNKKKPEITGPILTPALICETREERQKISIDIEINLIINGKKITL